MATFQELYGAPVATILADSVNLIGQRLVTYELIYPRIIHAELMTHRMLSRNAASSRAVPVAKLIQAVLDMPFIPESFDQNQPGMQAGEALPEEKQIQCKQAWLEARDEAVRIARELADLGAHKQLVNRLLEPFQWYTALVTATEWSNFFALRCHPAAQPEFRKLATMMRDAMAASTPRLLRTHWRDGVVTHDWHNPLVPDAAELAVAYTPEQIRQIGVGRAARVSYTTHDRLREGHEDVAMFARLVSGGHMSPLEHVAHPVDDGAWHGNLRGWKSMRQYVPNEHDFALVEKN